MNCKDFEKILESYSSGELPVREREDWNAHLAVCAPCRARLEQSRRLQQLLSARASPEPSPQLLAECRRMLEEALDHELASVSWKRLVTSWWTGAFALTPLRAASTLSLVALGFSLGWVLRPHAPLKPEAVSETSTPGSAAVLDSDLGNVRINAITQVAPSPDSGGVRITLDAERRMTLEGSLDDPRIRQILVDAVKGYSNPGIRRESLDALRGGGGHPSVREALLYAVENDPNLGLRLEAIKSVSRMEWGPEVQAALLHALAPQNNPGVRVASVNALIEHANASMLPLFERLAATDPDRYVRLKSQRAIRKLEGE